MLVKHYGIYLAYPPGLDLRHEGLGRYLAAFMKGAEGREDIRFVVVCPSWSKKGLESLFVSEGVQQDKFEIYSPRRVPVLLRIYDAYTARIKRVGKRGLMKRVASRVIKAKKKIVDYVESRLVEANSYFELFALSLGVFVLAIVGLIFSPITLPVMVYSAVRRNSKLIKRIFRPFLRITSRFQRAAGQPKDDALVQRLYKGVERVESERMLSLIAGLPNVRAWYSPTAFWPAFNRIKAPRLMCVPDVVLSDFPVAFSKLGGERFAQVFNSVEMAIQTGQYFATYSNEIKTGTLVNRYGVHASDVAVIHHAPNDLSRWVTVSGFECVEEASVNYSRTLLRSALARAWNKKYSSGFANDSFKFLFYASQFRPNKNLISLLRAYKYLLRTKMLAHKLVLTGNPENISEIKSFILEHHLQNDVLCMYGLTIQELAACYKLADLAVNPSLSEGGCPFTFTEALSVGTPVVMARIPVTEEVLSDPTLQQVTLFDPYDWKDIASKIIWALENRALLLKKQQAAYEVLSKRTWTDVVNEHIDVLEQISADKEASLGTVL